MDLIDFTHRQWTQFAHFVDSDGRHVEITSNAVKAGLVDFAKQVSYGVAHLRNLGRQMSSGADDICVTCGRSRSGCQTCLFRQCPVCMKVGRCQLRHRQHFCFACFGLRSLLCKRTPCLNCHDFVLEQRYFHSRTLAYLETGIYCKMPSASSKFDRVWIYFNIERGELLWRSFQLQNNLPLHQGSILMSRINRITLESATVSVFEGPNPLLPTEYVPSPDGSSRMDSCTFCEDVDCPTVVVVCDSEAEAAEWHHACRRAWISFAPGQQKLIMQRLESRALRATEGDDIPIQPVLFGT